MPGPHRGRLLRARGRSGRESRAPVGIEDVGLRQQRAHACGAFVDADRAAPSARRRWRGVEQVALEVARPPQVQHVGAVQGHRAAGAGAGDDARHAQRPHTRQRRARRGRERHRLGVADLLDLHQRQLSQHLAVLRFLQQLLDAADHRHHDAGGGARLLQLGGLPAADGLGHGRGSSEQPSSRNADERRRGYRFSGITQRLSCVS